MEYWFGPGFDSGDKAFFPGEKLKLWFGGGPEVDQFITETFKPDVEKIADGSNDAWKQAPLSCVAGIVLMDQFTRNMYRGTPQSFALDPKALEWALHLVDTGLMETLPYAMRVSVLLPLMHSEDIAVQQRGVELFAEAHKAAAAALGEEHPSTKFLGNCCNFMMMHYEVVKRWGRFPHRNAILGRESTPEEVQGLADGSIKKF